MSAESSTNCCLTYRDRHLEINLYGPAAQATFSAGVFDYSEGVCTQIDVGIAKRSGAVAPTSAECLGGPFDGNTVWAPDMLVGSIGVRPFLSMSNPATPNRPSVYRWEDPSFRYDPVATIAARDANPMNQLPPGVRSATS